MDEQRVFMRMDLKLRSTICWPFDACWIQWREGGVSPGRSRRRGEGQNSLTENILTTLKPSLMKFAEWANSSLSQQTITTHLVNWL